jgi:hypothetical protein
MTPISAPQGHSPFWYLLRASVFLTFAAGLWGLAAGWGPAALIGALVWAAVVFRPWKWSKNASS